MTHVSSFASTETFDNRKVFTDSHSNHVGSLPYVSLVVLLALDDIDYVLGSACEWWYMIRDPNIVG